MFLQRKYEKYTNYNGYICDKRMNAHEVEETRLIKAIQKMSEKYKDPYIRFMWIADVEYPMCILYENLSENGRKTKLVPFDEVEKVIFEE